MKFNKIILLLLFAVSVTAQAQYWEKINNIPPPYDDNYWLDVYFLQSNSSYGWICGFNGMVIRTTDGGNTWTGDTVPGAYHLESIHFATTQIGYTSGVEGIWKTTNGGQTWFDIKPIQAGDTLNYWGNYFYNANNGILVGMGCGGSLQYFWRTTNGGTTWTYFNGNEFDSGLTDAILLATGQGYASSSGKIWHSTDYGYNWSVISTTGSNLWQEEITYFNQSFLVPYAGDNCSGGGAANGGMRFSTDGGASWTDRNVGVAMFGAFILSPTEAWACGYNMAVYHTTDAGQNWTLRNCGITPGNLDDIWFIGSNNGWVVGQGVYRYSTGRQVISKTLVDFRDGCIGSPRYDTLFLDNYNFYTVGGSWTLQGANPASFNVITPNSNFNILPCNTRMFVIEFDPATPGIKTADLRIDIPGYASHVVGLHGKSIKPTATPADTLVILDSLSCGTTKIVSVEWKIESGASSEYINSYTQTGSYDVTLATQLPIKVTQQGVDTKFTIVPSDTGWQESRFAFRLFPCDIDTFITIRFFGLSPIINSIEYIEAAAECEYSVTLEIPVSNTGNTNLNISNLEILKPENGFSIIGWKSGFSQPRSIKPGEADTIIVEYAPSIPGIKTAKLRITNNDKTTARGKMNPFDVELNGSLLYTKLDTKDTIIDLGKVCIGDSSSTLIKISNSGNLSANLYKIDISEPVFRFVPKNQIYPIKISPFDTLDAFIYFIPDRPGDFIDTILIYDAPCEQMLEIIVKGQGVTTAASWTPKLISGIVYNYIDDQATITITNDGSEDITIMNYSFSPSLVDWNVSVSPALPQIIKPRESLELTLTFSTSQDSSLITNICFDIDASCPIAICLDINYKSINDPIAFEPDPLDFGLQTCTMKKIYKKIMVVNLSAEPSRVDSIYIEPANTVFSIVKLPVLPKTIAVGDSIELNIEFLPTSEGSFIADIVAVGEITTIRAEIKAEFKRTLINPKFIRTSFGEFERCEPRQSRTFQLYNQGLLDDTLDLTIKSDCNCFSIDENIFIIPAGDTIDVTIYFDPQNANLGMNTIDAVFVGRVCGEQTTIHLTAVIIEPDIAITPNVLEFPNVWPGDTLSKDFTIENNSIFDITIYDIYVSNNPNIYLFDVSVPITITSGAVITIPVDFIAQKSGSYRDSIFINYSSKCDNDTLLIVNSSVSEEIYQVHFTIEDYEAQPYEDIAININLENEIPKFRPDSLSIELNFDPWLLVPSKTYFRSGNGLIEINSLLRPGYVKFYVPGQFADTLFLTEGIKFRIEGFTYPSTPNITDLAFGNIEIYTGKTFDLTNEDGSLAINPVCTPTAGMHLILSGSITLKIKKQIVSDGLLELDILSTKPANASISIYSINGIKVSEHFAAFEQGSNNLEIDLFDIPNGTYYFVVNSSTGQVFSKKFILLK